MTNVKDQKSVEGQKERKKRHLSGSYLSITVYLLDIYECQM